MRFLYLIACVFVVSGCSSCPFSRGDEVVSLGGLKGVVLDIGSRSGTNDCTMSVYHENGTMSRSENKSGDGYYDTSRAYVSNWKYRKAVK